MSDSTLTPYINRMNHEDPLFYCEVVSDNHQLSPFADKRMKQALDDMLHRDIRHVFFTGDLTNNGFRFQFQALFTLLKNYPFDYQFALGNHDTFHHFHEEALRIPPELKEYVYRQQVYHKTNYEHLSVYVLNTQKPQEDNMYFERNQLAWLDEQLAKDQKQWKLILCHHPLADSHPNSEQRSMHIGFQNAKLLDILRKYEGIVYASGHLHNSYTLNAMCQIEKIVCVNIPGFEKIDFGENRTQVTAVLSFYHDFLFLNFYDHKEHHIVDSVFYVYDFKKNCIIKEYAK